MTDDRMVNKHYDLTGPEDLEVLLDELIVLVEQDVVPTAEVRARLDPPGHPDSGSSR